MPDQDKKRREEVRFEVLRGDPRTLGPIPDQSVHLVVTAPPEWPIPLSSTGIDRFGEGLDYPAYLPELKIVLKEMFRVLVPGGRLVCIASDIWLSRREHGRHRLLPFTADLSLLCRDIGYDHLTPVIWHRPPRRRSPAFLGKPYEPNAAIPSDAALILMERKPGGYRKPTPDQRSQSRIARDSYRRWFRQMWTTTAEDGMHAPFPVEIAARLIRMFSYWGDTVLDPFCGSGVVLAAALQCHRNGIGIESDPELCRVAVNRVYEASNPLFNRVCLACKPLCEFDKEEFFPTHHEQIVSRPESGDPGSDSPDSN